jgi:hypothetical protein
MNWKSFAIAFVLVLIAFLWLEKCVTTKGKTTMKIVHKEKTEVKTRKDTSETKTTPKVFKSKKTKAKIILDTIKTKGVEVLISDSLVNDTILFRYSRIIKSDSTIIKTISDTVYITRVDTVFVKAKKTFWIGFGLGYLSGLGTAKVLSK